MADNYEHHGVSGRYVMLASGEMVPADQAPKVTAKPEPVKAPAKSSNTADD
jgi:hypothetical protein